MSKSRKPIQINCEICGKTTIVGSGAGRFCKDCYRKRLLEEKRNYARQQRYEYRKSLQLKCQICGKDLTDFKKLKDICHECRIIKEKERYQEKYKENRERHLAYSKAYYQMPEHKARHRIVARESLRRKKARLLNAEEQSYISPFSPSTTSSLSPSTSSLS